MTNAAMTFKIFSESIQNEINETLSWQSQVTKKQLTEREQEVLYVMSLGWDDNSSAEALNITSNTYRAHRKAILNKLNARNQVEAIAKGFRSRLFLW